LLAPCPTLAPVMPAPPLPPPPPRPLLVPRLAGPLPSLRFPHLALPPEYAKVDAFEHTSKPKVFTSPLLPYVRLWDMPGAGTPKVPTAGFYQRYALYAMDLILLVYKDTVNEVFLDAITAAAE
jgi:hypothetical protein